MKCDHHEKIGVPGMEKGARSCALCLLDDPWCLGIERIRGGRGTYDILFQIIPGVPENMGEKKTDKLTRWSWGLEGKHSREGISLARG